MNDNNTNIQDKYKEARNADLFKILIDLGYKPERDNSKESWFLSPLRNEKSASFKLNKKINKWYDHGAGFGGNTIDFFIRYYSCTPNEAMTKILNSDFFSFQPLVSESKKEEKSNVELLNVGPIFNPSLKDYLLKRGLDFEDYKDYLHEVHYKVNDKKQFSIGFKNIHGGYELRNKYFKNSIGTKGLSIMKNGSTSVSVFEGFLDFISFQKLKGIIEEDVIVLNSVSSIKKAYSFLKVYDQITLYLDNDEAGVEGALAIEKSFGNVLNKNHFYSDYNDINDKLLNKTKEVKRGLSF